MANILDEIGTLVEQVSPLIGSVLGSPLAGLGVSLLANAFGANPKNLQDLLNKIKTDPNSSDKIRELELAHEDTLVQAQTIRYQTEASDKQDARKYSKSNGWIVHLLAISYTAGFFAYVCMSYFSSTNFDKGIFHDLLNVAMLIYSFYFGSSYSRKN